jgi:ABC-2 type transport system permease protein
MSASRATTTMVTLVRREFWEHRILWTAPALLAALLIVGTVGAALKLIHIQISPSTHVAIGGQTPEMFVLMQYVVTLPQYLVMALVLNFYLLDCLYTERKDRSILFWKSLPVSDGATVASKFLVALVVVPLGVYLLGLLTSLLFSVLYLQRLDYSADVASAWSLLVWLKVQAGLLLTLLLAILWYAPWAAYLALVSAWARRSVFLWATLIPVFAFLAEKLTLGTHYISDLLEYRTWGIWQGVPMPPSVADIGPLFANIDLWLGVAVAAALAFATIRIRRYRDDT